MWHRGRLRSTGQHSPAQHGGTSGCRPPPWGARGWVLPAPVPTVLRRGRPISTGRAHGNVLRSTAFTQMCANITIQVSASVVLPGVAFCGNAEAQAALMHPESPRERRTSLLLCVEVCCDD